MNRDEQILYFINKHYNELLEALKLVPTYEKFCDNLIVRKAIILDLVQIGENINKLSEDVKNSIPIRDIKGIIGIRNHLVHGYNSVDNLVVWNTINNNINSLISRLNEIIKIECKG